jgi:pimeloyl-ACP methyl ester carboxylesterase
LIKTVDNDIFRTNGEKMIFTTLGNRQCKKILLIHGMEMAGENYCHFEKLLPDNYLIIPTLDGHHKENKTVFISLEEQVDKIIQWLNENNIGELFCIAGTSLGALVAFEIYKRNTIQIQRVIFDGGPFFNCNRLEQMFFEMSVRSLNCILRMTNGTIFFPERYRAIKSTVLNFSRMATKEDIKNISRSIFNLEIPEEFNRGTEIIFLYGSKEHALKSMKRFKGRKGYHLIVKEKLRHAEYVINIPEEYAKIIGS